MESLSLSKYDGENVTAYVKDATTIIEEIMLCFLSATSTEDLVTPALKGLVCATDLMLRMKVEQMMLDHDVDFTPDTSTDSDQDTVLSVLRKLDALYRIKVSNGTYGPATKPKFQALQGAADGTGKLEQDRTGSGPPTGRACYACGSKDHLKSDPSCPKYGQRVSTHGLDEATNSAVQAQLKAKFESMPERKHIPDDAEHTIQVNGQVVAKYCRHCGRFGKGKHAHFTTDHKGRKMQFQYQAPSGSPLPPPLGTLPGTAALAPPPGPPLVTVGGHLASASTAAPPPCPPDATLDLATVPTISTEDFLNNEVSYDFGTMPTMSINLASLGLDEDSDDENASLLAFILKAHDG